MSSFFNSPRLFTSFTSKVLHETEAVMSPTSILDSKPFSAFKNPFWSEANSPTTTVGEHKRFWDKLDSKGLVDALVDDTHAETSSKFSQSRMVLFGSQLRNPQLGKSAFGSANSALETCNPPRVFTRCLSVSEMELSEDYTRVISHGPNPRTTHIFDNCIVESSCFDAGCSASAMDNVFVPDQNQISYPSDSYMSSCFYCNKNLGQGTDIYMYR